MRRRCVGRNARPGETAPRHGRRARIPSRGRRPIAPPPERGFRRSFHELTLELFEQSDIQGVLAEVRRVPKSSGRLGVISLTVPSEPNLAVSALRASGLQPGGNSRRRGTAGRHLARLDGRPVSNATAALAIGFPGNPSRDGSAAVAADALGSLLILTKRLAMLQAAAFMAFASASSITCPRGPSPTRTQRTSPSSQNTSVCPPAS